MPKRKQIYRQLAERLNAVVPSVFFAYGVGAFEGAIYEARGYYRPEVDCIMFSRDDVPFCAVCRRAIERVIDFYAGRLTEKSK